MEFNQKFFVLLIAFCSITILSIAQLANQVVSIVPNWSVGDIYTFSISKSSIRWNDDDITQADSSSCDVQLKVIAATKDNYKIKWTYATTLNDFGIPDTILSALIPHDTTEVIYTTSVQGEYEGIDNWKEIAQQTTGIVELLLDTFYLHNDKQNSTFQKSIKPLVQIFNSKQGVENVLLKEIHLLHYLYGAAYELNETYQYPEKLPNLFGGKAIEGTSTLFVDSVNKTNSYASISREMTINPDDAQRLILDFLKKLNLNEKQMKTAISQSEIDIHDTNTYEFNLDNSIPTKIETVRNLTLKINGLNAKRLDHVIVTQID